MHQPVKRIVNGAPAGVIFIHGILGTPRFFDDLADAAPPDWSVMNLLLPGHGGTVTDFGRVRRGEWEHCVEDAIDEMAQSHSRVYLVGHSMGALMSILAAVRQPERIAGMILMAVPLRLALKPSAVLRNILKGVGLGESPEELARYYGTAQDWCVWRYIPWIPRYLELFSLCRRARQALPALQRPARAFMHGRDELVSRRSCNLLADCPAVTLTMLPDSMHHTLHPRDKAALCDAIRALGDEPSGGCA